MVKREYHMTLVYYHLTLFFSLFTTKTLTCMNPQPCTDTESRWYYSWNACYVFSTNERMKKNKQRGQIKREKGSREENTDGEKERMEERGIRASFSLDSSACFTQV